MSLHVLWLLGKRNGEGMDIINEIVRRNLISDRNYRPYCGNWDCKETPRSFWNGNQFQCKFCGWVSQFEEDFIATYKKTHYANS